MTLRGNSWETVMKAKGDYQALVVVRQGGWTMGVVVKEIQMKVRKQL
jgi:hypothetical protein